MIKRLFYGFQLLISALLLFSVVAQDAVANDIYINAGVININGIGKKFSIPFGQYLYLANSAIDPSGDPLYPYAMLDIDCGHGSGCSGVSIPQGITYAVSIRLDGTSVLALSTGLRGTDGKEVWSGSMLSGGAALYGKASGIAIASIYSFGAIKFAGTYNINNFHLATILTCPTENSEANCKEVGHLYFNATVNITHSSCVITTPHDIAFVWTALSPSAIANDTAGNKVANISMNCDGGATPVSVTFSSINGYYDAANGIVNTDKDNLGIQLSWQKTGAAIQLDQELNIPAADIPATDFNISAKPVQTGEGKISGGAFSTAVTMSVEYR